MCCYPAPFVHNPETLFKKFFSIFTSTSVTFLVLTQKNEFFWIKYICSISLMHDAIYYIDTYIVIPMPK